MMAGRSSNLGGVNVSVSKRARWGSVVSSARFRLIIRGKAATEEGEAGTGGWAGAASQLFPVGRCCARADGV